MIGQTISHYQITAKLGSGGMATVYKAHDLQLDRDVALKFLLTDLLTEDLARQRLIQEAKAASKLDHPNIATIYEIGETGDQIFISMAFYEGKTLREILREENLDLQTAYSIAIQVLSGLAEAHKSGIVHRDIKPENILITNDTQAKILDFGIAKVQDFPSLTQHESTLGTAAYMSPEQVQGMDVDHRSDIFSFGELFYEMLTSEKPFKGDYISAVSYAIVHEEPSSMSEFRSDVPPQIEQIVLKTLAKDRDERYQNAEDVKNDLTALIEGETTLVSPPEQITARRNSWNRYFAAVSIILLLTIVFLSYFLISSNTKKTISLTVVPFEFEGNDANWMWLGEAITELLNSNLEKNASITTLSAQKRIQIEEKIGTNEELLTFENQLKVARQAKTSRLVIGKIRKKANTLLVNAQLFDTKTGELLADLTPVENDYSKLNAIANALYSQIVTYAHVERNIDVSRSKGHAFSSLDALKYYLEGRDAAFDRRHTESIQKLSEAIRLDPTFINPYYWLAYEYAETRETQKAKEILAKGKPYIVNLSNSEKLQYLAQEAMVDGRWKDYITYQEQRLKINPNDAEVMFSYGFTIAKKFRQMEAGITAMKKSLKIDSTYTFALNELSYAYLEKGDPKTALDTIEKYAQLNPADVNPLDSKAEIMHYIGQYEQSIAICDRILAMQPDFFSAYVILVRNLLAQRKYSRANVIIAEYLQKAPNDYFKAVGYMLQAQAYLQMKSFNKALDSVNQAILFDPTNLETYWIKGRLLLNLNKEKAYNAVLAELKLKLDEKGALNGRWFLYHLMGVHSFKRQNAHESIVWFTKAIDLYPRNRSFYLVALAKAYEKGNDLDNAFANYKAALDFNPSNAFAAFGLASTSEKSGKIAEAKAYYSKAVKLWGNSENPVQEYDIAMKKLQI